MVETEHQFHLKHKKYWKI